MDTADSLTCYEEVLNVGCFTVYVDVKTAVLVVECGVNEDRLFSDVDAVLTEHSHHSGDSLFDCTFTADSLDHGSVEPYCET